MTKQIVDEDFGRNLEEQFLSSEGGLIQIGDDVIARIVEHATEEVDDVTLESKSKWTELLNRKDKEDQHVRGIVIDRDPDTASLKRIAVSVRMAYGRDMYDLALKLRRHIKSTVEKMTRVVVPQVDIRIVGITVAKGDKNEEVEHVED